MHSLTLWMMNEPQDDCLTGFLSDKKRESKGTLSQLDNHVKTWYNIIMKGGEDGGSVQTEAHENKQAEKFTRLDGHPDWRTNRPACWCATFRHPKDDGVAWKVRGTKVPHTIIIPRTSQFVKP